MIKQKTQRTGPIEIDLTGPNGNAFYLIAMARRLAQQFELDGDAIIAQMMSGDYENLITVFDDNFGDHVILLR